MPINDVRCGYCGDGPCTRLCEPFGHGPHWKPIPEHRIETEPPYSPTPSPMPVFPPYGHAATKGCICPPTSELTCKRWDCGRKSIMPSQTTSGTAP